MNKLIILSFAASALISTTNSFGMLRVLARNTVQSPTPRYARSIMMKLTPEQAKSALSEFHKVNHWYNLGLQRNKRLSPENEQTRRLLQTQTSLIENIKNFNNANIKTLRAKNSTGHYDINDFSQQLELLEFLENQLADRGLFNNH